MNLSKNFIIIVPPPSFGNSGVEHFGLFPNHSRIAFVLLFKSIFNIKHILLLYIENITSSSDDDCAILNKYFFVFVCFYTIISTCKIRKVFIH